MSLSFLEWPVRKQLAGETSPLHRARIKVLSYALHLRFVTTAVLLAFYIGQDYPEQAMRTAVLLLVVTAMCVAVAFGLGWRHAIHAAVVIFMLMIWTNLFAFDDRVNLVIIQYVAIISTCAFYGLGNRWGLGYSVLALVPFFTYAFVNESVTASLAWGPVNASREAIGVLLSHNFIFLILINYYFFNTFKITIGELNARTTELSENLASLESSQKRLEEEYVHQKYLLASISHDIKSPLRFLMTTTGRLARTNPEIPTVRAISQSSSRLYNFMKNLLEYTELRYKSNEINFSYLDLNELVGEKVSYFQQEAESNSNRLINAVDVGTILKSNAQLISIILHNLIDNANKATYEGEIMVGCEDHRNELRLIVMDSGPGMESRIMNWINGSQRVPGPEDNSSAFGMGLLIVKEVASLIRATLVARPVQPHGTSIHIVFSKNSAGS